LGFFFALEGGGIFLVKLGELGAYILCAMGMGGGFLLGLGEGFG
jgi:hypothetical protein